MRWVKANWQIWKVVWKIYAETRRNSSLYNFGTFSFCFLFSLSRASSKKKERSWRNYYYNFYHWYSYSSYIYLSFHQFKALPFAQINFTLLSAAFQANDLIQNIAQTELPARCHYLVVEGTSRCCSSTRKGRAAEPWDSKKRFVSLRDYVSVGSTGVDCRFLPVRPNCKTRDALLYNLQPCTLTCQ